VCVCVCVCVCREELEVKAVSQDRFDGRVAIDWVVPPGPSVLAPSCPILLILHGLAGGSREVGRARLQHCCSAS